MQDTESNVWGSVPPGPFKYQKIWDGIPPEPLKYQNIKMFRAAFLQNH